MERICFGWFCEKMKYYDRSGVKKKQVDFLNEVIKGILQYERDCFVKEVPNDTKANHIFKANKYGDIKTFYGEAIKISLLDESVKEIANSFDKLDSFLEGYDFDLKALYTDISSIVLNNSIFISEISEDEYEKLKNVQNNKFLAMLLIFTIKFVGNTDIIISNTIFSNNKSLLTVLNEQLENEIILSTYNSSREYIPLNGSLPDNKFKEIIFVSIDQIIFNSKINFVENIVPLIDTKNSFKYVFLLGKKLVDVPLIQRGFIIEGTSINRVAENLIDEYSTNLHRSTRLIVGYFDRAESLAVELHRHLLTLRSKNCVFRVEIPDNNEAFKDFADLHLHFLSIFDGMHNTEEELKMIAQSIIGENIGEHEYLLYRNSELRSGYILWVLYSEQDND